MFLHKSVSFSGFYYYRFQCVLFWVIFFHPPLKKSETSACGANSDSFCSPTDLSLRFSLEGYNIFFGIVTQEICCWNELRIMTFETRIFRKPWKLKASLLVKFNISAWFVPWLFVASNLETLFRVKLSIPSPNLLLSTPAQPSPYKF